MRFIIIILCLVIERWTIYSKQIRRFHIFEFYDQAMLALCEKLRLRSYIGVIVVLALAMIIVGLIYFWLLHVWYGILGFIFAILVMLYSFDAFGVQEENLGDELSREHPIEKEMVGLLVQANRNIFAVVFWFTILGPIGAVLYRINYLLTKNNESNDIATAAQKIRQILDWIPVRLMALSYALVTHFIPVIKCWGKNVISGLSHNEEVLSECGMAALESVGHTVEVSNAEEFRRETMHIIDRALIIWLVVIALTILL